MQEHGGHLHEIEQLIIKVAHDDLHALGIRCSNVALKWPLKLAG